MPSKLRKAFSSGMKESSSRKRLPKTDEAETVSTSGDESFSHLDSGSPARTGKFLMSPNPLALQEVDEYTTLEELCAHMSTSARGCIVTLPSHSTIKSRATPGVMSSAMRIPVDTTATMNPLAEAEDGTPIDARARLCVTHVPSRTVGGPTGGKDGSRGIDDDKWDATRMLPVQKNLQKLLEQGPHQCPQESAFDLEKPPEGATIFSIASAGSTLCNGKIEIPQGSYLILDEACAQFTFQDITIQGGVVVCHGSGAEVHFQNVHFEGCSVIALEAAQVALADCHATDCTVFVTAHGAHTQVRMTGGTAERCSQLATVDAGAELRMHGVRCVRAALGGVHASGEGTVVSIRQCRFTCSHLSSTGAEDDLFEPLANAAGSPAWAVRALWLQGGAKASAADCIFQGVGVGITVMDTGTEAVVTGCKADANERLGVEVGRGAFARLLNTSMTRTAIFKGAYIGGVHTRAEFISCTFDNNAQCGLRADAGAAVVLVRCRIASARGFHGIDASGSGTRVQVRESRIMHNAKYGVIATHGARVRIARSNTARNGAAGLSAQEGGIVRVSNNESAGEVWGKDASDGVIERLADEQDLEDLPDIPDAVPA